MNREKLFKHLEQRYISKRDMISRLPLGTQADTIWRELQNRRRAKSTVLPLNGSNGMPFWYVTTDKMITASEKIVEALLENESEFDPYTEAPPVSTLEEVFFTSYVDGSGMTMQEAMEFLQGDFQPKSVEEQMIVNNRNAGSFASSNMFRGIDEEFIQTLAYILTEGMEEGGQDYRVDDWIDIPSMLGEPYSLPMAMSVPDRVMELIAFLSDPGAHPLIKASVAQAWMLAIRPFPEGNERLGRILSCVILLRAGYTFFSDVSLSALIARKSYGYYEAAANLLREENSGDMTYFIEYYLDLLSRGVDERKLRQHQGVEQIRAAEMEMARQPLGPNAPAPAPNAADQEQEADETRLFSTIPPEESFEDTEPKRVHGLYLAEILPEGMTAMEKIYHYADDYSRVIGECARNFLERIPERRLTFTTAELAEELHRETRQLSRSIRCLCANDVLTIVSEKGTRRYAICTDGLNPQAEGAYDPSITNCLKELLSSNSPKDKRLGSVLMECLNKGEVTAEDYRERGELSRYPGDMRLANQMGLVERVTPQKCRILLKQKSGLPELRPSQKEAVTAMYESFGGEEFSLEMVVATLNYSATRASATLHQLTLIKILDCRKEDAFVYQLLVNPKDNPECFLTAA